MSVDVAGNDLGCIVLGGELVELGEIFLEPVRRTLCGYAAATGLCPPQVRTAHFGAGAVAIGAAALARYRLIRPLASGAVRPVWRTAPAQAPLHLV